MTIYYSNAAELRKTLEIYALNIYESDKTTLKPYTSWPGYYETTNATKIPAVWVTGKRIVPTDWKINGIECVITGTPAPKTEPRSGSVYSVDSWSVRFTNYGTEQGTVYSQTMIDLGRALTRMFPTDQPNHAPRTDATYENLTIAISIPLLIPLLP